MPQNHELSIPGNPIFRAEYEIKSDQIVGNDACPCLGDEGRGGIIMSALPALD